MTAPAGGPPAVLVVDDDLDHLVIVRQILAMIAPGLPVTIYVDARDVAPLLREAPRGSLLLLDRRLGHVDGMELLGEVCRTRPDLRVALLSAALTRSEELQAIASGAYLAAEKPSGIDGWRRLLRSLLTPPEELPRAA